jgi:hypothetical protein
MRYEVNANTFMQLPYTTGTIQNVSNTDIEISNEQTIGTGIVLKAGETFAFNNATVYACARPVLNGGTGIISVVPFNGEGEGGESPIYVPKGSIAFASLPTTLNSTMLGWTYNVSDSFTTDSRFIEGAGVDYPAGENVVVVEPTTGTFKYDCFGGAYILPVANTTILGGVKSSAADGKVSVDNSGVMTINLPTASTALKGGIKVGTGVEVDANQKLNVTAATSSIIGGVKSSDDEGKVMVNNDGTMTYNPLGYRQPSTTYAVGDIAYHSALPTGWYLECTTEGISSNNDLIINTITINTTITDNTVVWTIRRLIGLNQIFLPAPNNSAIITIPDNTDLNYLKTPGTYSCTSWRTATTLLNSPINDAQFRMIVFGNSGIGYGGQFVFGATVDKIFYRTGAGNSFTNKWKQLTFEDETFPKYDNAAAHNAIYRGKDLTAYFNSGEMSAAIADGSFRNIYPGDYITKSITIDGTTYSNVKFIIMDLDYHLHCGDTETTAHHVAIMPEEQLGTAQMNTEHTSTGGYLGSKMWTEHMPKVTAGFEAAFGAAHILEHRELLSNAMDANAKSNAYDGWSGAASGWAWASVKANLANEDMVYGAPILSSSFFDTGECNSQLAAFRLNHGLICSKQYWWWLRSVAYASAFCVVGGDGAATRGDAASSCGVRPIALLH